MKLECRSSLVAPVDALGRMIVASRPDALAGVKFVRDLGVGFEPICVALAR